jgi:hypothetical protein
VVKPQYRNPGKPDLRYAYDPAMITFKSRVDSWLVVALTVPMITGIAMVPLSVVTGQSALAWIGVISVVGYALLLSLLVFPMSYTIGDGIAVRAGKLLRIDISWEQLISAELSTSLLSSPALSLRRIRLEFTKPNGKRGFVLISPVEREGFLHALVAASPRHRIDGDRVVER